MSSPQASTIDPQQIQNPSQIPPPGSQFDGKSGQGLVDVYNGTIPGDIDAQPAADELLSSAPDTGGLTNADYIYNQVMALFGAGQLPDLQSPSGDTVKSIVFVSGSAQGGYGAFHIQGQSQGDFDRIVVDSLNASGNYSSGSGLGSALAPLKVQRPHLLPVFRGAFDLQGVLDESDSRLRTATLKTIRETLKIAEQSNRALKAAVEARKLSAVPGKHGAEHPGAKTEDHAELSRRLIHANQSTATLVRQLATAAGGRQYLSTALFAAEIVESFELMTARGNAGQTDGEAVSRVLGFKLAPEIALVPGFNSGVTQQWWQDGAPDWVNDNSQTDRSADGNGAGVMFLLFLNDYLGVPLDAILAHTPSTGGAPLGQTYVALLSDFPALSNTAGADGASAFQAMVSLLQQNAQNPDGTLNLPANGNPYPSISGAQQGGLFTTSA